MKQPEAVFSPLVGQMAWNVRRGAGTFLTMEFGAPHLSVRDPIEPRSPVDDGHRRWLSRRRVSLAGDWHLWIAQAAWRLSTPHGVLESAGAAGPPDDEALQDLDGQKLLSARLAPGSRCWTLDFDLGAALEIWPADDGSEDVWSLHGWNGRIVAYWTDGSFAHEELGAIRR